MLDTNFTKLLTSAVKTPTDTETGEHRCFTPSDRQDETCFAMLFDAMMNMLKLGPKVDIANLLNFEEYSYCVAG